MSCKPIAIGSRTISMHNMRGERQVGEKGRGREERDRWYIKIGRPPIALPAWRPSSDESGGVMMR